MSISRTCIILLYSIFSITVHRGYLCSVIPSDLDNPLHQLEFENIMQSLKIEYECTQNGFSSTEIHLKYSLEEWSKLLTPSLENQFFINEMNVLIKKEITSILCLFSLN